MAAEPQDPSARCATGGGHLRASDADRERTVDVLKSAFVQGWLSRNELARRTGQALESRTYAELAGATTGIRPARAATRPATPPAGRPVPPAHRPRVDRKAIAWGLSVIILSPGLGVAFFATYYGGFIIFLVLAFVAATLTGAPAPQRNLSRGLR